MGVAAQDDGSVELWSYCTNEGLFGARIRTPDGVLGVMDATIDGQERVVFPADVLTDLEPDDIVTFESDYAGTGFFAEPLTIAFGELEPGTVVITGTDPEIVTPEAFEDQRVRCGFSATRVALFIGGGIAIVGLVAFLVVVPIIGLLWFVRRRRRAQVTTF